MLVSVRRTTYLIMACLLLAVPQVGFYDFVVNPIYSSLATAFPGTRPMLCHVLANHNHWKDVLAAPAALTAVNNLQLPASGSCT